MPPKDRVSDEPDRPSHALHGLFADPVIPSPPGHAQLSTWTFPATSHSARNSPSLQMNETSASASIFSPRLPMRNHPSSAPELDLASPVNNAPAQPIPQPSLFNTPNRSIFSSGPPTSSISSNTAQASMSSPTPVQSSRPLPLDVLQGRPSATPKRSIHYQSHSHGSTSRKSRIPRAEKDIDDPSITYERSASAERRGKGTPTALTRLFAAPEATPIVSRHSSYIRTTSGTTYTRASTGDVAPLPNHLYTQGLLSGKHSDITVHAFGTRYALHRLLLDRAPFFSSALSEPWFESSSKEVTLHPDDIDSNITQAAFELALKRLYGCHVTAEEDKEAIGLFATGCWLEMADLIDASVTAILRQMSPAKLGPLIRLVTTNYYGKPGRGGEMPLHYWDGVSGEIARKIIGGDGFFCPGEWERWVVAKRVFDRKLKIRAIEAGLLESSGQLKRLPPDSMSFFSARFDTVYRKASGFTGRPVPESQDAWLALYMSPDIAALLVLLAEDIHYVHLNFEQLQKIRNQRDVLGLPMIPEKVINDALWMQMELRQKVVNAPEPELELGLSHPSEELEGEDGPDDADVNPVNSASDNNKGKERDAGESEDQEDEDEIDSGSWNGDDKPRKFWIPNMDSTSVMGGNPDTSLFASTNTNRPYISRLSASIDPVDVRWESDFTASANERPNTERADSLPPITYTHIPPFRFAAEFPNARQLKEKKRVYSRTVWYAGSLWNVYIQKVETTKNTQLGVYLHRAKEKEAHEEHHSGSVDERINQVEMLMHHNGRSHRHTRRDTLDEDNSSSGADPESTLVPPEQPSRATTISNLLRGNAGSSGDSASLTKSSQHPTPFYTPIFGNEAEDDPSYPNANNSVPTLPVYVDGRPTIKTYFKIYSPSKGGRMLSVYESAPDLFNFSQSWGWRSSTMVLDDGLFGYDGISSEGGAGLTGGSGGRREERLRFMVVIGIV